MPKWSPKVNHLAYADDTIIFSSSDATSLQLIMEVLDAYEVASGQLINKAKSIIYMHHSTSVEVVNKVQRVTEIDKHEFPFTYLGCPIFYARRKMDYYQGLVNKVLDKLQSWKGLLYFVTPPYFYCDESVHNIYDVIVNGSWDEGINMEGLSMQQTILKCWAAQVVPRLKPILQDLPSIIVWEL
uniref:Reverse transcriptase domain-containing protein n=1 Tax=Nicotiana tabacum TaxID=4097 RepID=A0A1S4BRU4_TOBAC|nr:PREDICTED: uncharacterized protein LOC107811236 [Nicotiana tabacum]